MLKNLWYVIAASTELQAVPLALQLLGQPFVAFRDEAGQACLLSDHCVHRGGALSAGKVVDATVQCPYHGWRFNGRGECISIPAQPALRIPAKARVDAYPVVERHGWIWAFLGDLPEAERPPLPVLNWLSDPAYRIVHGVFEWDASWDRVMENGLDFAHAPFVHGSVFGDADHPEMAAFDITREPWGAHAVMTMQRPKRRPWPSRRPTGEHIAVQTVPGFHLSGPCTTLTLRPREGWTIELVSAHLPVTENRTKTFWIMGRTFFRSALYDPLVRARNLRIFRQDHEVLRRVRPERVPDGWQNEVSVKSDALQIAMRQRFREWERQGNAIDSDRIAREFTGRKACAIPCPSRRDTADWAIDAIPIVEAND